MTGTDNDKLPHTNPTMASALSFTILSFLELLLALWKKAKVSVCPRVNHLGLVRHC